ncbi:hypothetical protein K469DRAFT_683860 [Zopfia rhizophila CBS 207.26]|uniref:Uncharacterized protein n=1 Tax=Zopfia rhizophila CBS 207.26 TaxID=1314779 RepID=A0A6A6DBM3_9PEZI|nr:hypothetical protein K469DRAFT_683860 [Zopfia rhizophila CBS 207.26]
MESSSPFLEQNLSPEGLKTYGGIREKWTTARDYEQLLDLNRRFLRSRLPMTPYNIRPINNGVHRFLKRHPSLDYDTGCTDIVSAFKYAYKSHVADGARRDIPEFDAKVVQEEPKVVQGETNMDREETIVDEEGTNADQDKLEVVRGAFVPNMAQKQVTESDYIDPLSIIIKAAETQEGLRDAQWELCKKMPTFAPSGDPGPFSAIWATDPLSVCIAARELVSDLDL